MKLSIALEEFYLSMRGEVAPSTEIWYQKRLDTLVRFLGNIEVTQINAKKLRLWRSSIFDRTTRWANHPTKPELNGGLSDWSKHGYIRACRRFFKWMVEEDILDKSPAKQLRLPPLPCEPPKAITHKDLALLLKTAFHKNSRDVAIVCILADTGCRVGGLAGLKLDDLELDLFLYPQATVREKGRNGRKNVRNIYFSQYSLIALKAWLTERPQGNSSHVFVNRLGKPLTESGIYLALKRLALESRVDGRFNPHSFRHGSAKGMLLQGASLDMVSQLLGHRDVKVTEQFYARWDQDELAELHSRFSWLNMFPKDEQDQNEDEDEGQDQD